MSSVKTQMEKSCWRQQLLSVFTIQTTTQMFFTRWACLACDPNIMSPTTGLRKNASRKCRILASHWVESSSTWPSSDTKWHRYVEWRCSPHSGSGKMNMLTRCLLLWFYISTLTRGTSHREYFTYLLGTHLPVCLVQGWAASDPPNHLILPCEGSGHEKFSKYRSFCFPRQLEFMKVNHNDINNEISNYFSGKLYLNVWRRVAGELFGW